MIGEEKGGKERDKGREGKGRGGELEGFIQNTLAIECVTTTGTHVHTHRGRHTPAPPLPDK